MRPQVILRGVEGFCEETASQEGAFAEIITYPSSAEEKNREDPVVLAHNEPGAHQTLRLELPTLSNELAGRRAQTEAEQQAQARRSAEDFQARVGRPPLSDEMEVDEFCLTAPVTTEHAALAVSATTRRAGLTNSTKRMVAKAWLDYEQVSIALQAEDLDATERTRMQDERRAAVEDLMAATRSDYFRLRARGGIPTKDCLLFLEDMKQLLEHGNQEPPQWGTGANRTLAEILRRLPGCGAHGDAKGLSPKQGWITAWLPIGSYRDLGSDAHALPGVRYLIVE